MTQKRGLPKGFSLQVSEDDFADSQPAELGSYLDDDYLPPLPAKKKPPKKRVEKKRAESRKRIGDNDKVAGRIEPKPAAEEVQAKAPEPRRESNPNRRRKNINMKPKTLQMFEALLEDIRRSTRPYDASGAELQEALVRLAFDARSVMRFDPRARRGRYGSDTADAFVESLQNSIGDAILVTQRQGMGQGSASTTTESQARLHADTEDQPE